MNEAQMSLGADFLSLPGDEIHEDRRAYSMKEVVTYSTPSRLILGLPLLTVTLLPSVTRGECGDYVIMGKHNLQTVARPESTERQATLPLAVPVPVSRDQSKPCSRPHCNRLPMAPLAPPATVLSTSSQEWASLAQLESITSQTSHLLFLRNKPVTTLPLSNSVYRPPR